MAATREQYIADKFRLDHRDLRTGRAGLRVQQDLVFPRHCYQPSLLYAVPGLPESLVNFAVLEDQGWVRNGGQLCTNRIRVLLLTYLLPQTADELGIPLAAIANICGFN